MADFLGGAGMDEDDHDSIMNNLDLEEGDALLNDGGSPAAHPRSEDSSSSVGGLLSLSFYQQFFNVDTDDVVKRLRMAAIPERLPQDLSLDYYGPFWISTTLILLLCITGNLSGYVNASIKNAAASSEEDDDIWSADFSRIPLACSIVYSLISFVPFAIWFVRSRLCGNGVSGSAFHVACVYGYSLTAFIPATLACVVPIQLVRWAALLGASALSVLFLVQNIWNPIASEAKAKGSPVFFAIVGTQLVFVFIVHFSFYQ